MEWTRLSGGDLSSHYCNVWGWALKYKLISHRYLSLLGKYIYYEYDKVAGEKNKVKIMYVKKYCEIAL